MWDFTEDDKRRVEEIYQHFLPLYPNIDKKLLYDRKDTEGLSRCVLSLIERCNAILTEDLREIQNEFQKLIETRNKG